MKKAIKRTAALALVGWSTLSILASTATYAGPPFATDDPEPVPLHHYEFYIASQFTHEREGRGFTGPAFELNYGAAPNLQLHAIAPFVTDKPEGEPRHSGYGDTELGAKFRFIQETTRRPQVAIFPIVELPTGNENKGLGSGHTQFFLPVWVQKGFGKWVTYGGGGYWINPGAGNKNWWFTGWEVQRNMSERLTLGAEIFHATASEVGGSGETGANVGAIINFDEGHHLLVSAGRHLQGPARFLAYVGYQWTWGPHEKEPEATEAITH